MGGCGSMGMSSAQNIPFSDLFQTILYNLGYLASQVLLFLTSGPVLGFLAALLMLLLVIALLKFIIFGRSKTRTVYVNSKPDIVP